MDKLLDKVLEKIVCPEQFFAMLSIYRSCRRKCSHVDKMIVWLCTKSMIKKDPSNMMMYTLIMTVFMTSYDCKE